ncbi:MAG: hypothetical protein AAGG08_00340 [Actinomycetota bacterium]
MSDRASTGSPQDLPPPSAQRPRQPMRPDTFRRSSPNYAVRRIGAAAGAVAILIVSVIVIGRAFGDDDGGSTAAAIDANWNTVVTLTNDEILLIDPESGDVVGRYPATSELLDDQSLVHEQMLVTMTDFGRISIIDLVDGSIRRGQAGVDETMLRSRENRGIALIGPDVGGDLTVIDIAARTVLSVGDVAGLDSPLMFANATRVNEAGTHVAVSDGRSFQTIIVDLAESAATPIAGQIVGINDSRVVTAQRAGASTELEFYDLTGERLGSVDLPTPLASMLTPRGEVVAVDETGSIRLASPDGVNDVGSLTSPSPEGADTDEDPTTVGATDGVDAVGGTRLLVTTTDAQVAVVDDRGEQLSTIEPPVDVITWSTRCVNAGGGFSGPSSIVDVDRSEEIGQLNGLLSSLTSVDGCTASMLGSGTVVDDDPVSLVEDGASGTPVWHDGELRLVAGRAATAVAPDGRSVATTDELLTRTLLVDLDSGDSLVLATEPVVVHFAQR